MMEEEFIKEEIKLEESNKTDDEVAIVTNIPEGDNTEPTVKITSWKRYCRPEPIQTVQSLGYGIFSTVYAQYIYDRVASDLGYSEENNSTCNNEIGNSDNSSVSYSLQSRYGYTDNSDPVTDADVQAEVAFWNNILISCNYVFALWTQILWSAYSDRAGRKVGLLVGGAGSLFRPLITLLVSALHLPIWMLCIGEVLEGITGSPATFFIAIHAHIADTTTHAERAKYMLIVQIAGGLGSLTASISVGYMIDTLGYNAPLSVSLSMLIIVLLYCIFLIPETITSERHAPFFTIVHFKNAFLPLTKRYHKWDSIKRWSVLGGMITMLLYMFAIYGGEEMVTYYVLNPPLCWSHTLLGYYRATRFALQSVGAVVITRLLFQKMRELGLVLVAIGSALAYNIFLSFSDTTSMIFISRVIGILMNLPDPMLKALVSKSARKDDQGSVLSLIQMASTVSLLLTTLVYNAVYSATIDWYSGFIYLFGAMFCVFPVITTVLLIWFRRKGDTLSVESKSPDTISPSNEDAGK